MLLKTRSRSSIKKHAKNQEERQHLDKIASLGCCICGAMANVHHLRSGQGMGQRASHFETIPLCYNHHQGKDGIHTLGTKPWQAKYGSELELLDTVRKMLKTN